MASALPARDIARLLFELRLALDHQTVELTLLPQLQAFPVRALRLVAEAREAEPALQRTRRVKPLRTPWAAAGAAVRIAELRGEATRLKSFLDVGRNDGVATGRRQPREELCERQRMLKGIAGNSRGPVRAATFGEVALDDRHRVRQRRGRFGAANQAEYLVEGVTLDSGGEQRVPGQREVAFLRLQRVDISASSSSVSSASGNGSLT